MECGVDIIEIRRIKQAIDKHGEKFLNRIFTDKEIEYCKSKGVQSYASYAVRCAAKESIGKLLKTGFNGIIDWKEIEVNNIEGGAPLIELYGDTKKLAKERDINDIKISLSHSREYAISMVIGYWQAGR